MPGSCRTQDIFRFRRTTETEVSLTVSEHLVFSTNRAGPDCLITPMNSKTNVAQNLTNEPGLKCGSVSYSVVVATDLIKNVESVVGFDWRKYLGEPAGPFRHDSNSPSNVVSSFES